MPPWLPKEGERLVGVQAERCLMCPFPQDVLGSDPVSGTVAWVPSSPATPFHPKSHLPRLLEASLQVRLLFLHFALPFLHLLQLNLMFLQLFQLCLVFCPFQPQGLQLLLQIPYLGPQALLLLQRIDPSVGAQPPPPPTKAELEQKDKTVGKHHSSPRVKTKCHTNT